MVYIVKSKVLYIDGPLAGRVLDHEAGFSRRKLADGHARFLQGVKDGGEFIRAVGTGYRYHVEHVEVHVERRAHW